MSFKQQSAQIITGPIEQAPSFNYIEPEMHYHNVDDIVEEETPFRRMGAKTRLYKGWFWRRLCCLKWYDWVNIDDEVPPVSACKC
jgi:hypothetical protein